LEFQLSRLASHRLADINEDVYISIPQGWYYSIITNRLKQHEDPRFKDLQYCMQLVKNLYGTKQAAWNWYLLLSETLTSKHHGFKASKINAYLFVMIASSWFTPTIASFLDEIKQQLTH
jgi:hypothetical protein